LMAGCFETTTGSGETAVADDRVWFTRVLGSTDRSDDESLAFTTTQSNYIDVGRNDGDSIVGLGGPVDGIIYVFKFRSIWRLVPTGIDTVPYRAEVVTRSVGANTPHSPNLMSAHNHRNIVLAEDEFGQSVLYFIGLQGAHRISSQGGVEYVGWDVTSTTFTGNPPVTSGAFFAAKGQLWWVDGGSSDGLIWVYTPRLARRTEQGWSGGWATYRLAVTITGAWAITMNDTLVNGVMYPTMGVFGVSNAAGIYGFSGTSTTDAGTAFTPAVQSKPFLLGSGTHRVSVPTPILEAEEQDFVQPTVVLYVDHGRETRTVTAPALTGQASQTRVAVPLEGLECDSAQAVSVLVQWASTQTGVMDAVILPYRVQEWLI
jgi:hypothetical protein